MKKGVIGFILMVTVLAMLLFFAVSCRTKTSITSDKDTSDSVRIEYKEKLVKVPVKVYVEVPAEEKERLCKDSVSNLETSFALSKAEMIWIDGVPFLRHSLANKPQRIEKTDTATVTEKEHYIYKTRRVTYTKVKTVKEEPSLIKKIGYGAWGFLAGVIVTILVLYAIYRLKKKAVDIH